MSRKYEVRAGIRIKTREIKDKEITFKEEEIRLKEIDITFDREAIIQNTKGIALEWYGARVLFLVGFYQINQSQLKQYLGISRFTFKEFITNSRIPTKKIISRLSFFFEIEKEYFTDKEVTLIITEQNKIKYVRNKSDM